MLQVRSKWNLSIHQVSRGNVLGDDGDAACIFDDSSFDMVESSAVIYSDRTGRRSRTDSLARKEKTREKLETAVVDQCIVDIQG